MRKHSWLLLLVGVLGLVGCSLVGCSSQSATPGYTPADFAKRPPPAGYAANHGGATAPTTAPPTR